jgi:hypothetical protein
MLYRSLSSVFALYRICISSLPFIFDKLLLFLILRKHGKGGLDTGRDGGLYKYGELRGGEAGRMMALDYSTAGQERKRLRERLKSIRSCQE